MTRSARTILLLTFAGQVTSDDDLSAQRLMIDRALKAWEYSSDRAFDNATLGKVGNSIPGFSCIVPQPKLSYTELPQKIRDAEYAVRGEIVKLSAEIQKEMDANPTVYKFAKLLPCNIGNPQAVGQKPLTFYRQVLSVLLDPKLLKQNKMPADVQERGEEFAATNPGAYSHSKGSIVFRKKVAQYIDRRDGLSDVKADPEDIFLTDGASPAVKTVLELLIENSRDVIMIPIPQYPLYSASVTRLGGTWVGYEMTEDYRASSPSWGIDVPSMEKIILRCRRWGQRVKAIVVINPGNPTGNVLSEEDVASVIQLAEKYNMVILADEVYQDNIYSPGKQFHSFRKVAYTMYSTAQIFSFHSISKGYYGECGLRGGYVQMENVDKSINDEMYKMMSMNLCSNTVGQAMMAQIVTPPVPGDASYKLFESERSAVFDGMVRKAGIVHKMLSSIPGIKCMPIEGAMYAFPQVVLPNAYIKRAKEIGKPPDTLYCIEVLKELGVIMVPGNGFGQRPGTYHYRLTILPEQKDLENMLQGLKVFQEKLYEQYGEPPDPPTLLA